jgi:hypothetical protein
MTQPTKFTELNEYAKQMAENHAMKIDTNFWLVVKQKPNWMPAFLYRSVIKKLVAFQEHRYHLPTDNK